MIEYIAIAKDIIKHHEGFSHTVYVCPAGKKTIGWGHNLDARGISTNVAEILLEEDMSDFIVKAQSYPWFNTLNDARKAVIIDMLFNLGSIDDWHNFQSALVASDWGKATDAMRNSLWFKQVGVRAQDNIKIMLTGSTNGVFV